MQPLYKINQQIKDVLDRGLYIDEETGEYLDESDLNALELAFSDKLKNVCLYAKELTNIIAIYKAEKARLDAKLKIYTSKHDWLISYIERNAAGVIIDEPEVELKWRKSTRAIVTDESQLKQEYTKIKVEPDTAKIKKMLIAGVAVSGAVLQEKNNPQIK